MITNINMNWNMPIPDLKESIRKAQQFRIAIKANAVKFPSPEKKEKCMAELLKITMLCESALALKLGTSSPIKGETK